MARLKEIDKEKIYDLASPIPSFLVDPWFEKITDYIGNIIDRLYRKYNRDNILYRRKGKGI